MGLQGSGGLENFGRHPSGNSSKIVLNVMGSGKTKSIVPIVHDQQLTESFVTEGHVPEGPEQSESFLLATTFSCS